MVYAKRADGSYSVESYREEGKSYRVDLRANSCSCPHFVKRLAGTNRSCKHIDDLKGELAQQTALGRAADKAAGLSDADLMIYAQKRNGTSAGAACWLELAARQSAEVKPAPREIPAGVEAFLVGATPEERERALAVYR